MTRTWTVCRQYSPRPDGERRWDQAYQLLVRLGCGDDGSCLTLIAALQEATGYLPALLN